MRQRHDREDPGPALRSSGGRLQKSDIELDCLLSGISEIDAHAGNGLHGPNSRIDVCTDARSDLAATQQCVALDLI